MKFYKFIFMLFLAFLFKQGISQNSSKNIFGLNKDSKSDNISSTISKSSNGSAINLSPTANSGSGNSQGPNYGLNLHTYISLTSCDSLVSPSGKYIYYQNGIYDDTVKSFSGVDSFITIYVQINPSIKLSGSNLNTCQKSSATIVVPATQSGVDYYIYDKSGEMVYGPV